jgi:hypothetical protein
MNEDDLTNNFTWLIDDIFGYLIERNRAGIIAVWNGKESKCWGSVCVYQVCDVMADIGNRLSLMPPAMPELTEGHHLIKSGDATDQMSLDIALKIPPEFQSVVVVFSDSGSPEGDSVFCIGSPIELTFMCVRSGACAEASLKEIEGYAGDDEDDLPFLPPQGWSGK